MRAISKLGAAPLLALAALALLPAGSQARGHLVFRSPAARPTGHAGPKRKTYSVKQAPGSPDCTPHFCVHWVARGPDAPRLVDANGVEDGDGVPDYVERVEAVAEHVYEVENVQLGWRDPLSDGGVGGGQGKTDVYLAEIGGSLFGYASPDVGQAKGNRLPRRLHGYLVLDNDYNRFEFAGTTPLDDLEVTFAHEYNHILQFGYDAYQDSWFAESTATWMEDQVYPEINDYLRYMPRWKRLFGTPITASSFREYGSAVWNHWLANRYGPSIIRKAWAGATQVKPAGFAAGAYDRAIRAAGASNFEHDFALFAADLAEWRTDTAFPEGSLYGDMPRQGALPANGPARDSALNHTTFQLLRVDAPSGRTLVVETSSPRGVAAGLALVGRVGDARGGEVVSQLDFEHGGGRLRVRLSDPGDYRRITAVLVNADTAEAGFSARRLDWDYLTDMAPFRARARVIR